MRVPLLDLQEQLRPLREEILAAVTEVIDSTGYILGPKVREFEEQIAAYCGTAHAVGVSSGTDALLVSLMALGVGEGDLVLTTPFTFFATVGSILRLGAQPLFVDIDPTSYNLDPQQAAELLHSRPELGSRLKAMIPVHLYGQCADMAPLLALAEEFAIPVVEDAAQAIGAAYPLPEGEWRKAGSMGTAGCFSFFPSKNLGGVGDGGMVVCQDESLYERLMVLRVHGGAPKYYYREVGGNFRLDPLQAAVLSVKLAHLPEWHRARRENAGRYQRLFTEAGLVAEGKVRLPAAVYAGAAAREPMGQDYHIYNQYVIRAAERDRLVQELRRAEIGVEIYYPVPMHRQECLARFGFDRQSFPEAEQAAAETLALPIYPELTGAMQERVVEVIADFYRA